MKDYQQYRLIKKMVSDLAMDTEIFGIKTVRLAGGLVMSSRNSYLSAGELVQAAGLYRVIQKVASHYKRDKSDKAVASALDKLKAMGFCPGFYLRKKTG